MSGKSFVQWQWHLDGRRTCGVWFDVFVSKLPGPLTMHIAAFTGLYIIVGCLGETAMCSRRVERRFDRTRFGRKEVRSKTNRRLYPSTNS